MKIARSERMHLSITGRQLAIALIAVVSLGCSGAEQPPPIAEAEDTVATVAKEPARPLPEAVLPDGNRLTLELALTNDEIGQGLMFRNSLPTDRGMLFLFDHERVPSFWMKNTLIPLDMVFLSPEGVVIDIIKNALPCTTEPCPQFVPRAPAMAVLEVAAGVADQHGLNLGDTLTFERISGYPRTAQR